MTLATLDAAPSVVRLPRQGARAARLWLHLLAGLVFAMVMVGGATRLTGAGLSITEWRPVTGAVPPLDEAAWEAAFAQYRRIPQYDLVNKGMTLDGFKTIYWWEWSHRQLGRLVGLVFGLGFVWLVATRRLRGRAALAALALGALGGLQGVIGWIMVASGLEAGMTAVAPVKLMLHLTLAGVILAGLIALAVRLGGAAEAVPRRLARGARALVALVLAQIALGALVAGLKAGLTYNTWPLMDGRLVPPLADLLAMTPWWENLVANVALVQFDHRLGAYLLLAFALWHAVAARRAAPGAPAARRAAWLAGLVAAQAVLGVATLLLVVPLWAGLAHQAAAMVVLGLAAAHAARLRAADRAV